MKNRRLFLYIDGASRGNPGPAGIGVVIFNSGKKKLKETYKYIGEATNNIAEYNALIHGLEEAAELNADEVVVNMDSELISQQLNGVYKVKNSDLKPFFDKALCILKGFKDFKIVHIDRENNKDADRLANKAINLAKLF